MMRQIRYLRVYTSLTRGWWGVWLEAGRGGGGVAIHFPHVTRSGIVRCVCQLCRFTTSAKQSRETTGDDIRVFERTEVGSNFAPQGMFSRHKLIIVRDDAAGHA